MRENKSLLIPIPHINLPCLVIFIILQFRNRVAPEQEESEEEVEESEDGFQLYQQTARKTKDTSNKARV